MARGQELIAGYVMFGIGAMELVLLLAIVAAVVIERTGVEVRQFSLRSLLIFMTFIALCLGVIVILARRFH